ncbi:hypothetical protein M5689_002619 [Euphorbia peplus]|nr:hypothetical protein M5689_002619 [Euphorbia peplus]
MPIGCMNNLYSAVKNLDIKYFRTEQCKLMLLHPRNGAPTQCRRLKMSIDDIDTQRCFSCPDDKCFVSEHKIRCYYSYQLCPVCGSSMSIVELAVERKSSDPVKAGAFLKGFNRLILSDDLQLMHLESSASFSFLSDLEDIDSDPSMLEVRDFYIREEEVSNMTRTCFSLLVKIPYLQIPPIWWNVKLMFLAGAVSDCSVTFTFLT